MKKIILLILMILPCFSYADEIAGRELYIGDEYIIRLQNGDLISGKITEFISSEEYGKGFKFKTLLGTAPVYEKEIKHIMTYDENFKHDHRVFIMPTAEPIGTNHFIGAFNLLFFYGGFGITDYFSATFGTTAVPGLWDGQQAYLMNLKSTVYQEYWKSMYGKMSLAVGYNLAFINEDNRFMHFYAAGTFRLRKTGLTLETYYKSGGQNFYEIAIQDQIYPFIYADGAFGIGIGVDHRFHDRHGLFFIGELWVSDIARPRQSAGTIGLRLANSSFAADFGLNLIPSPLVIPYMSFVWTPF
jgi:hypothetical protein